MTIPTPTRAILLLLYICFATVATAQVRIKHGGKRFENRKNSRVRLPDDAPPPPKRGPVTVRLRPAKVPQETAQGLDARFYVRWRKNSPLQYADFRYNRNLYNKFVAAADTDLTRIIYPDYREFYQKLNERRKTTRLAEDSLLVLKAEKMMRAKTLRITETDMMQAIDSGSLMQITIDSPAASVIIIQPVVYATGENSYYFNIPAVFSKEDSWMIVKSHDILEHEQIHFDIFELYARKMRRMVIETIQSNYEDGTPGEITDELALGFEPLFQQLADLQIEFDRQTGLLTGNNAPLYSTNNVWKRALQQQLAELEKYAATEGTILLN